VIYRDQISALLPRELVFLYRCVKRGETPSPAHAFALK
jgi:hypothetical protein